MGRKACLAYLISLKNVYDLCVERLVLRIYLALNSFMIYVRWKLQPFNPKVFYDLKREPLSEAFELIPYQISESHQF
jgi:hypothetical protein